MRARELFDNADRDVIADLISELESRTSAELAPVVATESGRYQRAEDSVGAVLGLLLVSAAWLLFQGVAGFRPLLSDEPSLGLLAVLLLFLGGLAGGAPLAARFSWLRRPFVTRRDMRAAVDRAAAASFHVCRLRSAHGRGVLLYVSLYERSVRVLADDQVAARIPSERWNEVKQLVADGLAAGSPRDAVVAGLRSIGTVLEAEFPHERDSASEVANVLRIVD